MLDSLAPPRRRLVLGVLAAAALAVVAGLVTVVLSAMGDRSAPVMPVSQDAQPPVLLVPGYGGATSGLEVLARALRAEGRQATVVHLAGNGKGDLNVQAGVVQAAVRRASRGGAHSVDLVGYSAGGITVRLWLRTYDGGSVARRIVTLGSPHHGSDLAALASDIAPQRCPVACRQLATDSDLIRSLNSGDETPAGPDWVSIWTDGDKIATPPETASLTGALDVPIQRVCPAVQVTHSDLPSNPVVIAMVEAELRRTPPAVPPASVCVSR